MTCLDDANFAGLVSLFVGAENLTVAQFTSIANFAKSNGITTLFIKVFQWGSILGANNDGLWYGGMAGVGRLYPAGKRGGGDRGLFCYLCGGGGEKKRGINGCAP